MTASHDNLKLFDTPMTIFTVHEAGNPPFITEEIAHGETPYAYYQKLEIGECFSGKTFTFARREDAGQYLQLILAE